MTNFLFEKFKNLSKSVSYISLACLPTPIEKLKKIGESAATENLFIKRDDLSGTLYGGNKVRKLEFILSDAISKGSTRIITSGAVGSNHALAVAKYSSLLGLKPVLMLFGDQKGEHVKANLLADYATGAEMYYDFTFEDHQKSLKKIFEFYKEKDGREPYVIPAGGTSVHGLAGYINAAFELKFQIENEEIPSPDYIYLPFGTMGTAAGLLLGLRVAGVNSKVIPVQVVPSFISDEKGYASLINSTNQHYHSLDSSFPIIKFTSNDISIDKNYLGQGYGIPTKQADEAIERFDRDEGIKLDQVYSGKAAAAFLDRSRTASHNETLLFWNTKNSVPFEINYNNMKKLPQVLQQFFN